MQCEIKTVIKTKISQGLNPDKLVTITINKNDLKNIEWFGEGNEMLYNNKRYDIVKSTENKTSTTYYCINDIEETELIANLENHIVSNVVANKPVKNESSKKIVDKVIKYKLQKKMHSFGLDSSENSR